MMVSRPFARPAVRYARRAMQRLLLTMARSRNYFLVTGMTVPIDSQAFMENTPWRVTTNMVRYAFLELCSRELQRLGIAGDIAEVGVGEGSTAAILNRHFAGRKLLLFDTFAGFDDRDLARNEELGYGGAPYGLPPLDAERTLARLPNRAVAEVYPGWFPESAAGLESRRFALVHVDVGLYEPTYAALEWFHGRVNHGGYLLVADYEHHSASGVKAAVQQFAKEADARYTVLPDLSGTAVFAL
jgi:O-methyltransferase